MISALTLLACAGCSDGAGSGDDFSLSDEQNYHYTNTVTPTEIVVQTAEDVLFDWSALSVDLLDHDVDPAADIASATVVWSPDMDAQEFATKAANNQLVSSDTQVTVLCAETVGRTSYALSECVIPPDNAFIPSDYFTTDHGIWFVTLSADDGKYLMFQAFSPSPSSSNHDVVIGNDSALLDFDVDLQSLTPIQPTVEDSYTINWEGVTTAGDGTFFNANLVDQVMLARYDLTLDEIEGQFFDLETIGEDFTTIDVSMAQELTIDSSNFVGFQSGELWLLALRCTGCSNPAPPFLTVVEVQ